jgi:hypothetical protein
MDRITVRIASIEDARGSAKRWLHWSMKGRRLNHGFGSRSKDRTTSFGTCGLNP